MFYTYTLYIYKMSNKPKIIPNNFIKGNNSTDYEKLITKESEKDTLFIFNDNVEHHKTNKEGSGNAKIRPYNKYGEHKDYPKSAGVSTGEKSGVNSTSFKSLDQEINVNTKKITIKKYIDSEIDEIKKLIKKHNYKKIYFSAKCSNQGKCLLDTKIFDPGEDVKKYITTEILKLGKLDTSKTQKTSSGQDNYTYTNMKTELEIIQKVGDFLGDTTELTKILDKRIQELQKKEKDLLSAKTSVVPTKNPTKNSIRVMNWNIKHDLYENKNGNPKTPKTPEEQKKIRKELSGAIYTQNPDIVCTQEMSLIHTDPNKKIFDETQNIFVGQDTNKKFKKTYNIVSINVKQGDLGIVYNNTLFEKVSENNRIAYCPQQDNQGLLTGDIKKVNINNNAFKLPKKLKSCGRGIVSVLLQYKTDQTKYLGIINVHLPHTNNNKNNKFVTELEKTINDIKKKYNKNTKFILLGDFNEYLQYATGKNSEKISGLTLMNDTNIPTLKNSSKPFDLQYTDLNKINIKVSQKIQSDHYYVLSELEFP